MKLQELIVDTKWGGLEEGEATLTAWEWRSSTQGEQQGLAFPFRTRSLYNATQ